jgi:hypothetical protein
MTRDYKDEPIKKRPDQGISLQINDISVGAPNSTPEKQFSIQKIHTPGLGERKTLESSHIDPRGSVPDR